MWCSGNEPICQCRRHRRWEFDSWVGKMPGVGNGNPLQYSCLENSMDRGAWRARVHGVTESDMTEWLSRAGRSLAPRALRLGGSGKNSLSGLEVLPGLVATTCPDILASWCFCFLRVMGQSLHPPHTGGLRFQRPNQCRAHREETAQAMHCAHLYEIWALQSDTLMIKKASGSHVFVPVLANFTACFLCCLLEANMVPTWHKGKRKVSL